MAGGIGISNAHNAAHNAKGEMRREAFQKFPEQCFADLLVLDKYIALESMRKSLRS